MAGAPAVWLPVYFQLFLIVVLTPAVTAGALGHEKEGNTLMALFGTELSAREIVSGKLLGRLIVLAPIILAALPLLLFMAGISDLSLGRLLFALLQEGVLTFALAAMCMLSSVWTRRTGDAILACYASITIVYLLFQVFLDSRPLPDWLDPITIIQHLVTTRVEIRPVLLLLHLGAWIGIGSLCLALAAARLRPACLGQQERSPGRWLWAFRPAMGNAPVRWRERYVIGLAPFPWLRIVPTWLAMLGVFSFSAILAITAIKYVAGPAWYVARDGQFMLAVRFLGQADPGRAKEEVTVMGIVLLVIGVGVVGVRCGGSIAQEKRRKTWEDPILTPLTLEEIMEDKKRGVLQATIPYLARYALPMFALSLLGGGPGVFTAAAWIIAAGLCMLGAAVIGTGISLGAEQSNEGKDGSQGQSRRRPPIKPVF